MKEEMQSFKIFHQPSLTVYLIFQAVLCKKMLAIVTKYLFKKKVIILDYMIKSTT